VAVLETIEVDNAHLFCLLEGKCLTATSQVPLSLEQFEFKSMLRFLFEMQNLPSKWQLWGGRSNTASGSCQQQRAPPMDDSLRYGKMILVH